MFGSKKEMPSIKKEMEKLDKAESAQKIIGAELPYPKYMLAIEDRTAGSVFRAFFLTSEEAEEFHKQKGYKGGMLTLQKDGGKSVELIRDFGAGF